MANNYPPAQMMYPNAFASMPSSSSSSSYPPSPTGPPPPLNQPPTMMMNNPNQPMHQHPQPHQHHPPEMMMQPPVPNNIPPTMANHNYNASGGQYPQQQQPTTIHHHHHQQQQHQQQSHHPVDQLTQKMGSMTVNQGWNQAWRMDSINLMAEKDIYSKAYVQKQQMKQQQQQSSQQRDLSCDRDIMRCTIQKMPDSASLLQKSRLPLGILLHPFKDDPNIPVIQDSVIVRCRSCRTYINPYVRMLDQRRWQCNLCHRINEVPEDFIYDYQTRQHLDIMSRPELNHGSIEFVASVEYMVRPPQPAIYLFVFECTASAVQLGYIRHFARAVRQSLDEIPGDSRALLGFIAFDSKIHFFNLNNGRPVHMIMPDIHDVFIPHVDSLLVKFHSCRDKIDYFLDNVLPKFPCEQSPDDPTKIIADHQSALGPALQVAFKLISSSGGRITLIQTSLPSAGNLSEGCVLQNREDPNNRTINSNQSNVALTPLLNPATDFFKKLALECSEHQVTVDLFNLSPTYSDLSTVGAIAKYSGGSIKYYGSGGNPASPASLSAMMIRFEEDMKHYLTRSIGFEAVMRLRSTRGISIHTFHGNFFVRSTDLIALPNVNPDSAYGIQLSISEDLKDFSQICFQAALLYTSSNGERRIRVHTIALPVVSDLRDVIEAADQDAITSLLAKMAVDRSCQASIQDAREALINANIDMLNAYRMVHTPPFPGLFTSYQTRLLPLYTLALLKHTAFRLGISTRIDERVYAMEKMKSMPIKYLMLYIYPNLYPVHYQFDPITSPPTPLQLSFANIDRNGVYLLDTYDHLFMYICKSVHPQFLSDVFNVTQWSQIPDEGDQNATIANVSNPGVRGVPPPPPPSQMMNGYGGGDRTPGKSQQNEIDSSTVNGNEEDSSEQNSGDLEPEPKSPVITLPYFDNPTSQRIHAFINSLIKDRPFKPAFHILREDSRLRYSFLQYMYDDRNESAFSYYEFLQHLQQNFEK